MLANNEGVLVLLLVVLLLLLFALLLLLLGVVFDCWAYRKGEGSAKEEDADY